MRWLLTLFTMLFFSMNIASAEALSKIQGQNTYLEPVVQLALDSQPSSEMLYQPIASINIKRPFQAPTRLIKNIQQLLPSFSACANNLLAQAQPSYSVIKILSPQYLSEYSVKKYQSLAINQTWIRYPPEHPGRLNGWKDSNLLYTGSITYNS